jgi:hypothetical protein
MLNICPTFRLCNLFGGAAACPPPVPYAYGHEEAKDENEETKYKLQDGGIF